ncbi:hypothetical protein PR003_g1903 [Phytophthora rubi]|uniref:Uncharacterized protein n=1 Tax=Phytophthora rubi TaxID=129364 RepID=A0A6A4G4S4_9STRA|nr:hypothetical protein PR002_g1764 [Phytophthora rubi]KAE9051199.1 hypothetical protein PR001_g1682 [Phytophthora rubi]KAE9357236.1 hypothetical protein PR003_g1903 [Phytophthora rubi]
MSVSTELLPIVSLFISLNTAQDFPKNTSAFAVRPKHAISSTHSAGKFVRKRIFVCQRHHTL